jgi:dTDP-4-dehydro-6-deoxy-alpha-D-glucopyranose 2,3-dehydratase
MKNEVAFLKSLATFDSEFCSIKEAREWLSSRNSEVAVSVDEVGLGKLESWGFDSEGNLRHSTGKFFSITGLEVRNDRDFELLWGQPIINQPEIGFLGILAKEINGVLFFLMQAKIEPGNVNNVQLSPTLQATKSNYTGVHNGNTPLFLEYFLDLVDRDILFDQLQSEQGSRFYRKRNRNIVVKVDSNVEITSDYKWLTLGQIKQLMLIDNVVNMDSRSIISSIIFTSQYCLSSSMNLNLSDFGYELLISGNMRSGAHTFEDILHWLSELKASNNKFSKLVPFSQIRDWNVTNGRIVHLSGGYFDVSGVQVSIENREVKSWFQPIIRPSEHGICAFFVRKINGVLHFLVQGKYESGNFDSFELAPSIQMRSSALEKEKNSSALFTAFYKAAKKDIIVDVFQSEEGGRFYQEQNRNMVIYLRGSLGELSPDYRWMTLGQLKSFLSFNNYVNIQARSVLACLPYSEKYD